MCLEQALPCSDLSTLEAFAIVYGEFTFVPASRRRAYCPAGRSLERLMLGLRPITSKAEASLAPDPSAAPPAQLQAQALHFAVRNSLNLTPSNPPSRLAPYLQA